MRQLAWPVIFLFATLGGICVHADEAQSPSSASSADTGRVARESATQVLEALSRKVTLEIEDLPLDEAVQQLGQLIDLNILFDGKSLSDEGISIDQSVSLKLGESTAWQTLYFLLKPLSLAWVANDGVLEITTESHASAVFVTRIYDVRLLCQQLESLPYEMFIPERPALLNALGGDGGMGGAGGGGMGGGMFSVPSVPISTMAHGVWATTEKNEAQAKSTVNRRSVESMLARLICHHSSLTWQIVDGEGGTISLGQGCLIVSQTYQGQFEVAGILEALKRLLSVNSTGSSIAAQRPGYPVEEDAAIFKALATRQTLEVDEGPLMEFLDEMADEAGFRIWIDQSALDDEGISTDQIVSPRRRMQKLPLGICLKKILEPLLLTYVVDEGKLVVTTQTTAEQLMTVRFYNLGQTSKIDSKEQLAGAMTVICQATRGKWGQIDGEGGSLSFVSEKYLVVRQTQQIHAEIALFVDDLTSRQLTFPLDAVNDELELRAYTTTDAETARDLEQVLPQLIEAQWKQHGSILRAGTSLLINQPPAVHVEIDQVMSKLKVSHLRQNPPVAKPLANQPEEPAMPESVDGQVK